MRKGLLHALRHPVLKSITQDNRSHCSVASDAVPHRSNFQPARVKRGPLALSRFEACKGTDDAGNFEVFWTT